MNKYESTAITTVLKIQLCTVAENTDMPNTAQFFCITKLCVSERKCFYWPIQPVWNLTPPPANLALIPQQHVIHQASK